MNDNIVFNPSGLYLKNSYFDISEVRDLTVESLEDPLKYIRSISFPLSVEAKFTAEIDAEAFHRIAYGVDTSRCRDNTSYTLIYRAPYQEQVRRHKKKRINKKWAKRYGYVTKFKEVILENVHIEQDNDILGKECKYAY